MVTETKVDWKISKKAIFYTWFHFTISFFGRTKDGGGVLVYIMKDIPFKLLKFSYITSDIECFGTEENLEKVKWLFIYSYNPNKSYILNHLEHLIKVLNRDLSQYEILTCIEDFHS